MLHSSLQVLGEALDLGDSMIPLIFSRRFLAAVVEEFSKSFLAAVVGGAMEVAVVEPI